MRSRVVDDPAVPLRAALDRGLDGYLVLEPQDALLLGDEAAAVVTLADGVPVLAYEEGGDAGGRAALDRAAGPGPYRAELYAVDRAALDSLHDAAADDLAVTPGGPADRLADDGELAARTRDRAPDDRLDANADPDAVEAFLADEERVAAIRDRAREEARERAREWGLTDQLADPPEEPR